MIDYLTHDGVSYPVRELRLTEYEVNVRVSSEALEAVLKDPEGEYVSREAQLIDELMFFYIPEELLVNGSDEEVDQYITDHLEWY